MEDLRGKTVLLTGASTGLGPYIARRLHKAGAKFVLSARNEEALKELAEELGDARVIVADLARLGEPERLAREAGDVDVLVSNAGVPASGRLATFKVTELDRAIAVNLRAGMVLAHQLVPAMLNRKGGHLVFMSSVAGIVPQAGNSVYNATKFALRGFALALREELLDTRVGVSVICLWYAITRNRAEVDVAPLQLKASLKFQALAPGLFATIARAAGATKPSEELGERQRNKR